MEQEALSVTMSFSENSSDKDVVDATAGLRDFLSQPHWSLDRREKAQA